MTKRFAMVALVVVLSAAVLAACGRKGAPDYPPGTTYPGDYPGR